MNTYTVIGLYPDSEWGYGSMRDATFVEHIDAESPTWAAIRAKREVAARREITPEQLCVIAVFCGKHLDDYEPSIEDILEREEGATV